MSKSAVNRKNLKLRNVSSPVTNPYDELSSSITTRVMACKLKQRQQSEETCNSGVSILSHTSRQSSKFLLGAAIPNSVIRADNVRTPTESPEQDKAVIRAKRDAFVQDLIKRVTPKLGNRLKDLDMENYQEKKEENVGTSPETLSLDTMATIESMDEFENDDIDIDKMLKEKRRVARRTSIVPEIETAKVPNMESLKRAIDNSTTSQHIVDVSNLEDDKSAISSGMGPVKKVSPIPSMLTVFSNSQSMASSNKSNKQIYNQKLKKAAQLEKKPIRTSSILKDSNKRSTSSTKPVRTVSINETKREDTQTQTHIRMMHIS